MKLFEIYDRIDEGFKEVSQKFINQNNDASVVNKYISIFKELNNKNRLEGETKDINFWGKKSFSEFKEFVDKKSNEKTNTGIRRSKNAGDSITLFENDKWLIVIPLDHAASCYNGKNTSWCTTKPGETHFSKYFYDNEITLVYLLQLNSGEKWAIAFHNDVDKYQLFDKDDNDLSDMEFKSQTGFNPTNVIRWTKTKNKQISTGRAENRLKDELARTNTAIKTNVRDLELEDMLSKKRNAVLANKYMWHFNSADIKIPHKSIEYALHKNTLQYDELCVQFLLTKEPYIYFTEVAGTKRWFNDGKRHREDGPAVEYADGREDWYIHGKYHREDGPANEWADGSKFWYVHGKLHREDGPAVEWANGTKEWLLHGKRHREDGPAIEYSFGSNAWYIHNEKIYTWKRYHMLSSLSPEQQDIVKLRYGEQLK